MKKMLCIMLAAALCVTAAGCRTAHTDPAGSVSTTAPAPVESTAPPVEDTSVPVENAAPPVEDTSVPAESTAPTEEVPPDWTEKLGDLDGTVPTVGKADASALVFTNPGKVRISYEGNRSFVKYITDPSELPEYEELKRYDEAFFRDHALLLVVETLNSGSVQVDIGSITVEGDVASVTLSREMKGDAGTADMATWMLWAEVEAGLVYRWELSNPSLEPSGETY